MKTSLPSWFRTTALAVISALAITGLPVVASAAPAAAQNGVTAQSPQATQLLETAATAFEGAQVSADGSQLTLPHALFRLSQNGTMLDILSPTGTVLFSSPLQAIMGDSLIALKGSLSADAHTLTVQQDKTLRPLTASEKMTADRFGKNLVAWFNIYEDYAKYAHKHDSGAFWGGTILGFLTGLIGGYILLFALGLALYPVRLILVFSIIGLPLAYVLTIAEYALWGTIITVSMLNMPALLSWKLSTDPIARKKAYRVMRATEVFFHGGDVARVR